MAELVFFYGTLMTPFNRTGRLRLDRHLSFKGHGTIPAALFDLGIYPAAVPTSDSRVTGEVYEPLRNSGNGSTYSLAVAGASVRSGIWWRSKVPVRVVARRRC